jgi:phosphodiesterase/alkaline phosphatase D-like protein
MNMRLKIVAASCANLRDVPEPPVWAEIRAERPDVLLLLGDNVYLERDDHADPAMLAADLRLQYAAQFAQPGFAELVADLRARGARLEAIYDDHDFVGDNRCGASCAEPLRQAARAEFVAAFAPVCTGADVYRHQRLGPVDVVVLDERFYRALPQDAAADSDAILGPAQWTWFEGVVRQCAAPYLVVASSTTLHSFGDQSWEQYPAAFARMTSLLRGRTGAVVVSGDVHRNAAYDESGVIEIVTSAVAQRSRSFGNVRQNYGVLTFESAALRVELRSLKVGGRFDFTVPLSNWSLP